jgi:hypothetical protein
MRIGVGQPTIVAHDTNWTSMTARTPQRRGMRGWMRVEMLDKENRGKKHIGEGLVYLRQDTSECEKGGELVKGQKPY